MIGESRFYSKDPASRVFAGDVPERRPATDEMREAAERFAARLEAQALRHRLQAAELQAGVALQEALAELAA